MSYRWFGQFGEKRKNQRLHETLQSAHMEIRAGAYLSYVLLSTILVFLISFILSVLFVFLIFPVLNVVLDIGLVVGMLLIPVFISMLLFFSLLYLPKSRAKTRKRKIDLNLPYAVNFISAMASAGVTPTEIFKSLSKQKIYSEVKNESAWIYRDVSLLGFDVINAIKKNIARTPSQKFKEFLQGMVVTVSSGGSLKTYFMHKAEQYLWENRNMQKQLIETLGVMAESYVTAAVAGILLLLIVLPLMMLISGEWNEIFLYIFILLVAPLIHVGFAVVIRSMSQEA